MAKKPAEKKTESTKTTAKTAKAPAKEVKEAKATAAVETAPKKKAATQPKAAASTGESCKIKSCKREYRAKGYCKTHYRKWRHGEYGLARYKTCKDTGGCRQPIAMNRHGYCETHFQNYYVKGIEVAHVAAAPAPKKEEKVAAAAAS